MKIIKFEHHDDQELKERLHQVTLKQADPSEPIISIYRNADIALMESSPNSLAPAQHYRLRGVMERLVETRKALLEIGFDMFRLNGFLVYWTEENDLPFTLLPPIIEFLYDDDGRETPFIVDGLHRVSLARREKQKSIQVVEVKGVSQEWPYYAYPNANGWKDVHDRKYMPVREEKRRWRMPPSEAYKLYRNFNTAFDNVGTSRSGTSAKLIVREIRS